MLLFFSSESRVNAEYLRVDTDEHMAKEGMPWLTKVLEPKSEELKQLWFYANTGVSTSQRLVIVNFAHAKVIYDVLAEGACTHVPCSAYNI
jgi:hypothetical protein